MSGLDCGLRCVFHSFQAMLLRTGYGAGHFDVWEEMPTSAGRTIRITSHAPGDDAWHTAIATVLPRAAECHAPTAAAGAMLRFEYNTTAALGHVRVQSTLFPRRCLGWAEWSVRNGPWLRQVSVASGQLREGCTRVAYASCACSGAECSHYTRLTDRPAP